MALVSKGKGKEKESIFFTFILGGDGLELTEFFLISHFKNTLQFKSNCLSGKKRIIMSDDDSIQH